MSIEEASPSQSSLVSEYWEQQFEKDRADPSLWTNNLIVVRHIYRLISGGSEEHWLPWFLNQYLPSDVIFERSFSVCCGDGAHELALAHSRRVKFIHAFDLSTGAIEQAKATFATAGISKDTYRFEVADADDLQIDGKFDLLLSTSALHHVTQLETLLSRLSRMLDPHGYFVVLEYVGPNRFQWRDAQLNVINGILAQLDPRFLKENRRIELGRPPLADFLAIDPSEAVRSEDILRLLPEYFTVEYLRNFNGTIIHPLYPLLDARRTNANEPDFDSIVRMILWIEDFLIRAQVLSSDFIFAICRSKELRETPEEAQARLSARERRFAGYIDLFDAHTIAGWAADTTTPAAPISVDLFIDDRLQATLTADVFRQDLKDAGYGDGRKGFSLPLVFPTPFARGTLAKLVVAGSKQVLATCLYGPDVN
ncbi:MAG TPA: class I SAM-dependent methyltransferase [Chthoniobacterales bacterium]|nr:class I SAM-dependent methyltransferase [Chthoniobacterales bacterium]